ncbi:MAG: pyridoxine 5'-phosphate synthase [Paracoccaceae bacterium]
MTNLSINLNKIALLRNSRGRDFPNVIDFAGKFISLGVQGITIHPRQDERHITIQDTVDLSNFLVGNNEVELNIEGYPSEDFLTLVEQLVPAQCTLVPDSPNQLTSDHGWNLESDIQLVKQSCLRLNNAGIRSVIFMDPELKNIERVPETGASRIELYTESYAASYKAPNNKKVFQTYFDAASEAQKMGVGVNAGHDLDLENLRKFLTIPNVLEVSIGHALIVECIKNGMDEVVKRYLAVCAEN